MLRIVKKSLRNKLLVSFIFVGLLPFIILLSYTLLLSETKIVNQTIQEQLNQANDVAKLINKHIEDLQKEIDFLASLDLMDDILAEDIDKRLSILLSKKATDFSLDLSLSIVNTQGKIVASSDNNLLSTQFQKFKNLDKKHFIVGDELYISTKVFASFDKRKKIGFLILEYNLHNLHNYLTNHENMHAYIINKNNGVRIGSDAVLNLSFTKQYDALITDKYVIVYEELKGILENNYLVYAVDKSLALKFLYDFIRFMLYVSVLIFLLIIFIALRYSKSIVQPIVKLTEATKKITQEQDYSTVLSIDSQDELATLSLSFNEMLSTTSQALESLEKENRLRLKRFVQLIEVFNTIIQTESEDECITVSMSEIKKITDRSDLQFSKTVSNNSIELYVTDFEKKSKIYFGSISLALDVFKDENEKHFYDSIASMITLQLDKIRLICRTITASQAKSAFISNMSHELRTPLNAIIGNSQFLITYEDLTNDQQDSVANIESSAHYLLGMINDILDIAKIEAGKMQAHKEEVDIVEIVESCYNMLKPLADEKGLTLKCNSNSCQTTLILSDSKMLQQIITNLLSNAIKFTEIGFIEINLFCNKEQIAVKIKDSGIGIEAEDIQRLFEDFTQVESVMQKKHRGTGLGLSLSKKMATILGGDLSIQSEGLGHGSEATLYILRS